MVRGVPAVLLGLGIVTGCAGSTRQTTRPTPSVEPTCKKGDRAIGAVCINEDSVKAGSRTLPYSTVYKAGAPDKVVWQDLGYVEKATWKFLTVVEMDGNGEAVDVEYTWDGRTGTYH